MVKKLLIAGLLLATVLIALGAGVHLGYRAGTADAFHEFVGSQDDQERRNFAMRYALGLTRFKGVTGQDLWVLYSMHPGVTDGFFVDLGSADGVEISNTWALERKGWKGVCIDPFPRNMQGRKCQVFAEAVDSVGGQKVQFQSPGSYSGGILSYSGWWVSDDEKKNLVEVTTTTLADILHRAQAPKYIHYLNVDIEGAEYEALRTFPFDEYSFGAITIEHNGLEDRRAKIRELLLKNGYRLEWAIRDQDWYVPTKRP